jgi:hypothetical protein
VSALIRGTPVMQSRLASAFCFNIAPTIVPKSTLLPFLFGYF